MTMQRPHRGLLGTTIAMHPEPTSLQQSLLRALPYDDDDDDDDAAAAAAAAGAASSPASLSPFSTAMADSFSGRPLMLREQTAAPATSAWGGDHQKPTYKDDGDDDLRTLGFGFPAASSAEEAVPADAFRASRSSRPQVPALCWDKQQPLSVESLLDEAASQQNGPASWFEPQQRSRGDCGGGISIINDHDDSRWMMMTSTSCEGLAGGPFPARNSRGPSDQPSAISLQLMSSPDRRKGHPNSTDSLLDGLLMGVDNNLHDANGRGHHLGNVLAESPMALLCHPGHKDQVMMLSGSYASEPAVVPSPRRFLSILPPHVAAGGGDRGAEMMSMTLGEQQVPSPASSTNHHRRHICGSSSSAGRIFSDDEYDDDGRDTSVTFARRPGHGYGSDDAIPDTIIGRCAAPADDEEGCKQDRSRITIRQKQQQGASSCYLDDPHQLDMHGGGGADGIMPYDGATVDDRPMTSLQQARDGRFQNHHHHHHHEVLTRTTPDGDDMAKLQTSPLQIPQTYVRSCSGLATTSLSGGAQYM